ncbi:type II secretion system protein GspG [uncultured Clostridium sp.]|uniref:type II secretion system protein GspG n=1 Tax=uncultured Clostridium sp. TaxID=59620 RepID=UPI0028E35452|nr:type II secretion system protein GspG [uncultured Clostridium sp.]
MKKVKKAFTLVELLVVIAIIAILAAIIAPNAFKAIEKSKVATAESDYRAIKTATLSYYSDMGLWPNKEEKGKDEENLFIKGSGLEPNWNGPYLEKWPNKNPWGGTYKIVTSGDTVKLELDKVPEKAAKKIDLDLDGTENPDGGIVIYTTSGGTYTVTIIISQ